MKEKPISNILYSRFILLLIMLLLASCGVDGSGDSGVGGNGNQPTTVPPNQVTPTPSTSGTGGVVLSVGSRTPQVMPTPRVTTTAQVTPTPRVTLVPQVTPTVRVKPTPQVTLVPQVTPTAQVTLAPQVTPTIRVKPTPQVTLVPQVTPTAQVTPIPQVILAPQVTPTAQVTPIPRVTLVPQVTPTVQVKPTPQITPTPRVTPTAQVTPIPRVTLAPQVTPTIRVKLTPQVTLVPQVTPTAQSTATPQSQRVVSPRIRNIAYFTQWGINKRKYTVKDIDASGAASKLTAINYAFIGISSDLKCQSVDSQTDYRKHFTDTVSGEADSWNGSQALAGNFNQLKELKAKYPKLKILISIGGWKLSGQFSDAADPRNVQSFVRSCIGMFINGNIPGLTPGAAAGIFDGIDIDWESPGFQRTDNQSEGGYTFTSNDTQNYTAMLAEFRKQLGNQYLLTVAIPASQNTFSKIQLNKIGQYVNWINLMTFNDPGNSQNQTNVQIPIYCNSNSSLTAKTNCIDYSVTQYRQAGIPAAKINLGLLFSSDGNATAKKAKKGQDLSQYNVQPGPSQQQAMNNDNKRQLKSHNYPNQYDETVQGDDNADSSNVQEIIDRVNYAKSQGLGGVFCWSLNRDDSRGTLFKAVTDATDS